MSTIKPVVDHKTVINNDDDNDESTFNIGEKPRKDG